MNKKRRVLLITTKISMDANSGKKLLSTAFKNMGYSKAINNWVVVENKEEKQYRLILISSAFEIVSVTVLSNSSNELELLKRKLRNPFEWKNSSKKKGHIIDMPSRKVKSVWLHFDSRENEIIGEYILTDTALLKSLCGGSTVANGVIGDEDEEQFVFIDNGEIKYLDVRIADTPNIPGLCGGRK